MDSASEKVIVRTGTASAYPVFVETGWQAELWERLDGLKASSWIVVGQLGLEAIVQEVCTGLGLSDERALLVPGGEQHKHQRNLEPIYNRLLDLEPDRQTVILAVGGGVIGDLAGFVAATFLRGIRWVQFPTTLLAAVDASVGGKTAVNLDRGKNLIGAFHQPELTYFNLNFLKTLPQREWICGFAEMTKHAFLEPEGRLLSHLETQADTLWSPESPQLRRAVLDSIAFKASVVESDERERDVRAILNLGHTVAHALESLEGHTLSHGEAVARGLAAMLFLSARHTGLEKAELERMLALLQKFRLPLDGAGASAVDLFQHMRYDKKSRHGAPHFVLLEAIGRPVRDCKLSEPQFESGWRDWTAAFGR